MGIIKALGGALGGSLADQWIDIIVAGDFDEYAAIVPGFKKERDRWRGSNKKSSTGVITSGSKFFVPENTVAIIFSGSGIENVISEPGVFEYQDGQGSIFVGDSFSSAIIDQLADRFRYGGISSTQKHVIYVNLREIRNLKFGTRGPQIYHDCFYDTDLEVRAFGSYTIQIIDPIIFIKNFVPANSMYYSFNDHTARAQLTSEFIQSFISSLNLLSSEYRISQLPSQVNQLSATIANDSYNAGTWPERFGFKVVRVAIENIELTPDSRELIKQYSANRMNVRAFEGVSQNTSNIAAQQKIAQGIQEHGLGDAGGMFLGMNMAQGLGVNPQPQSSASMAEKIELVKKMKDLLDAGIITEEEFNSKKKELLGL